MNSFIRTDALDFVKGDVFVLDVVLDGVAPELIRGVWFTSDALFLRCEMECMGTDEAGKSYWTLWLQSAETARCPARGATYDVTMERTDGNYNTLVHNGWIEVREKINEVMEHEK